MEGPAPSPSPSSRRVAVSVVATAATGATATAITTGPTATATAAQRPRAGLEFRPTQRGREAKLDRHLHGVVLLCRLLCLQNNYRAQPFLPASSLALLLLCPSDQAFPRRSPPPSAERELSVRRDCRCPGHHPLLSPSVLAAVARTTPAVTLWNALPLILRSRARPRIPGGCDGRRAGCRHHIRECTRRHAPVGAAPPGRPPPLAQVRPSTSFQGQEGQQGRGKEKQSGPSTDGDGRQRRQQERHESGSVRSSRSGSASDGAGANGQCIRRLRRQRWQRRRRRRRREPPPSRPSPRQHPCPLPTAMGRRHRPAAVRGGGMTAAEGGRRGGRSPRRAGRSTAWAGNTSTRLSRSPSRRSLQQ